MKIHNKKGMFNNPFDMMGADVEMIHVFSSEDESEIDAEKYPETLPILPLRNTVLFPGVITNIKVGREKSLELIKEVNKGNKFLGAVAQIDELLDNPQESDLYKIGTVAKIFKVFKMPDESTMVLLQGRRRFRLDEFVQVDPFDVAKITVLQNANDPKNQNEFDAIFLSLKDMVTQVFQKSPQISQEARFAIQNIESPILFINFICSNLNLSVKKRQWLLELDDIDKRAEVALSELTKEVQLLELKSQIQNKVKHDIDKQQRDYYLNQQLKTIREELGDGNQEEVEALKARAAKKKWPESAKETFEKELIKLQRINPSSMEYSIQLNYLDVLVELPWNHYSKDSFDLNRAQKILDKDHFGLEKVKARIIEYLAVLKLRNDMKSPIICLVGPPGVGKTSLGKSIATAIGRKYIRMSLGGLRDEAEIRGHRKTYIGAMPGRIIQNIRKAGTSNPVFVLDEIDKVAGATINGDPASALLEVLDAEQNTTFHDNFLEIDYDLSHVMFVATANTLSTIHPALRDRMEIIEVNGYLLEEKFNIAKKHLIPKLLSEHGMPSKSVQFTKEVIEHIIDNYTRESGVRSLEKVLAKVIRHKAVLKAKDESTYSKKINISDIKTILGVPRYQREKNLKANICGVVTGLAWTVVGGEILFVEASASKGKGRLTLTGNLGEVMKESATLALEYMKSHAKEMNVDPDLFENLNFHIHVPEGATPKDGPSAGITMFTALTSVLTGRKVKTDVAMTGEITLRGRITAVGGIKEKILAAKRANIKEIVLSVENRKDIDEINPTYIEGLKFHYIDTMSDVLDIALEKVPSC